MNHEEMLDEEWAGRKLDELFEVERFKKLGKENDHVFQALVFLGEASQKLSIARTILKDNNVAVDLVKMKEMLDMQQWVHDFSQYLREGAGAPYYHKVDTPVLIYWEDKWQNGKIINGYRTRDGLVHVQADDGRRISFGEARHKEFIKPY